MQRLLIPLLFVVGLALGISGTILAPRVAGRYLPEAIQGKTELVEGQGVQRCLPSKGPWWPRRPPASRQADYAAGVSGVRISS